MYSKKIINLHILTIHTYFLCLNKRLKNPVFFFLVPSMASTDSMDVSTTCCSELLGAFSPFQKDFTSVLGEKTFEILILPFLGDELAGAETGMSISESESANLDLNGWLPVPPSPWLAKLSFAENLSVIDWLRDLVPPAALALGLLRNDIIRLGEAAGLEIGRAQSELQSH